MLSSVLANFLLQFHYHSFDCLIFFRVLFGIKFSSTTLTFTFLFSHNSSTFLSIFLLSHFTSSQLFSTIPINCIYKRSILLTSLLHQFINLFLFICNVLVDGFSSIQFFNTFLTFIRFSNFTVILNSCNFTNYFQYRFSSFNIRQFVDIFSIAR